MIHTLRKTKILATLGPASNKPEIIEQLIKAGADGFRLNFSHGSHDYFRPVIGSIREISKRAGKPVALLQDLQGPKIRVGTLKDGNAVELTAGKPFTLTTRSVEGDDRIISTTYSHLPQDVHPGDKILIDDGSIELKVTAASITDVETCVVIGGTLQQKKGINLPGVNVSANSLTEKDLSDALFGIEMDMDYIALSFVRTAEDVRRLHQLLKERGRTDIRVIAKIEKPEAVQNLHDILKTADGVMVARGDLGVEMPAEKVPLIQKHIIESANRAEKLVITATQMLESMVTNARPTRAEASDVANAILDGTDVVMLSQETAVGINPARVVRTMSAIAQYTEAGGALYQYTERIRPEKMTHFTHAIVHSARLAAQEMQAKAIIVFTQSGATAQLASGYRPEAPIYAFTPAEKTVSQLALVWGVYPLFLADSDPEIMFEQAEKMLLERGVLERGDIVVLVSGTQSVRGATNMMKLERIGG